MKRFRLVGALLVAGLISGYAVARMQPVMYRSSATIQRVPPRVAAGTEGDAVIQDLDGVGARRRFNVVVSRTALERVIQEFNLYQRERESMIMEDVIALMFNHLSFNVRGGDIFTIGYTGSDPEAVKKVTQRIAGLFIDESLKRSTKASEETLAFLQARIDETGKRFEGLVAKGAVARPKVVEIEVVEAAYRNLLTRREEVLAMRDLEKRQVGEQFVLLDTAQLPNRPIGPNRLRFTLIGGALGIVIGALIMLAMYVERLLRGRGRNLTTEAV